MMQDILVENPKEADEILITGYRVAARIYLSKCNSLFQDTFSDTVTQTILYHYIHIAAEQVLEIHQKSTEVEETTSWFHIYQEIDIAL